MPRKRSLRNKKTKVLDLSKSKRISISRMNLKDSYVSLFLGALVVVIVAFLLFFLLNGFREVKKINFADLRNQLQNQLNQEQKPNPSSTNNEQNKTYVVKEGDTLWSIAENKYKDGEKWVEISVINNLSNPDNIIVGTKLTLPDNTGKKLKTHTVTTGENLWKIALNEYGDGFAWAKIATLNHLSNPNWINSGQILILP